MKKINNTQTLIICFILIVLFLFMNSSSVVCSMPMCRYGSLDAWVSLDAETWMNTTIDNISLQKGQPFFIKTTMRTNQDHIWLALYLFEPGTSSKNQVSFKVIKGPCKINAGCDLGKNFKNETQTVVWKIQVKKDPQWVNGLTPLSITGFFQKKNQGKWDTKEISFSLARIYIEDTFWTTSEVQCKTNHSSVFSIESLFTNIIFLVSFPIVIFLIWKKKVS